MTNPSGHTITDAEVLAVTGGIDESTGQPVVVLTACPFTGSGWGHVNYALGVEHTRSLLDRLTTAFETSQNFVNGRSGTTG